MKAAPVLFCFALFFAVSSAVRGETLEVGPGRTYDRIESAVAAAADGDCILVYANHK